MARTFTRASQQYGTAGLGIIGPLLNGASGVTAALWINPASFLTYPTFGSDVISIYHSTANAIAVIIDASATANNGMPEVFIRRVGTDPSSARLCSTRLTLGAWIHIATICSFGSFPDIYIDGVLANGASVNSASTAGTFLHTSGSNYDSIGANLAGTTPLATNRVCDGSVGDTAIWKVALTAAQIASLAKGAPLTGIAPQSLIWANRLSGENSPEPSLVGPALTLYNTPAKATSHPRVYGA